MLEGWPGATVGWQGPRGFAESRGSLISVPGGPAVGPQRRLWDHLVKPFLQKKSHRKPREVKPSGWGSLSLASLTSTHACCPQHSGWVC